jgi:hypothetical protein
LELPVTRMTYLWQACSDLDIQFEVFSQWVPVKKVTGDLSIMAQVLSSEAVQQRYSAAQITIFNQCRMYTRVIMLSDLTSGNGTQIDISILNGTTQCTSQLTWPRVPKPRQQDWRIWKEILHRTFLVRGLTIHGLTNNLCPTPPCNTIDITPTPHLHLQQIFQTLPVFYQHLLGIIAKNIIADDSLGASDGSCLHNTLASFAVKLCPRDTIATNPSSLQLTVLTEPLATSPLSVRRVAVPLLRLSYASFCTKSGQQVSTQ